MPDDGDSETVICPPTTVLQTRATVTAIPLVWREEAAPHGFPVLKNGQGTGQSLGQKNMTKDIKYYNI